MPEPDADPLAVAADEAERIRRRGLRRLWTTMLIGAAGGFGLAFALHYSATIKHPSVFIKGFIPIAVIWGVMFLLMRSGHIPVTPMWSMSRRQAHTIRSAIRDGAPIDDPRLASAVIEHARLANLMGPRALIGYALPFVVFIALWVASIHRHGVINGTLVFPCVGAGLGLFFVRNYISARRRWKPYVEPAEPDLGRTGVSG